MNIIKVISLFLVVVLCGSVGFAAGHVERQDSSEESSASATDDIIDLNQLVKLTDDQKKEFESPTDTRTVKGYSRITDSGNTNKMYTGQVEFNTLEEAIAARTINVRTKAEMTEKIKNMQDKPLIGNNLEVLSVIGYNTISTKGYQSITAENEKLTGSITDDTTEIKRDIVQKKIKENNKIINENPPTLEQRGKILSDMSDEQRVVIMDSMNKKECEGSYVPFCEFFVGSSENQAIKASFLEGVSKFVFDPKETEDGTVVTELVQYNRHIIDQLRANNAILEKSECKTYKSCKTELNKACDDDEQCERNKREGKLLLEDAKDITKVETNWLYSAFDAINNQDQSARASAKFFGFGADYDDIPRWLSEQGAAASKICIQTIDGYIGYRDDDSKTGGSTIISDGVLTQYGYDTNTGTLNVVSSINAKRTQTTPDGKTYMTSSIYIKAPTSQSVSYMFGIGYRSGDKFYKKILINKSDETLIQPGEVHTKFYTGDVELIHPETVEENSVVVYLKARTSSGTVLINKKTKVYPEYVGDDDSGIYGNNLGHAQDSRYYGQEQPVDTFWDGFDD